MKGHTLKRGSTWSYIVDLPPHPDGRRRQRMKGGFKTKALANTALANEIVRITKGTVLEPGKHTVSTYMEEWVTGVTPALSPNTVSHYRYAINSLINPRIGGTRLLDINPPILQRLYQQLTADGLSPRTVTLAHNVLYMALDQAVNWSLIPRNSAAAKLTLPKAAEKKPQAWTAGQAGTFLVETEASKHWPMWALFLSTGLRKGEVLGLRWQDVDMEAGTLSVVQTIVSVDGKPIVSAPKTKASRRTIPLMLGATEALERQKAQQDVEREKAGTAWQDSGLVFTTAIGGLLHPQNLRRAFETAQANAGVPRIRPHDMRHTFASIALSAGIHPKIVQEMLGHSTADITMNIYTHTTPGLHREAIEKIGDVLFPVRREEAS